MISYNQEEKAPLKRQKGFSGGELVIVISLLSLVAAISLGLFNHKSSKSHSIPVIDSVNIIAEKKYGYIMINSTPPNAVVYMNDIYLGKTPTIGRVEIGDVDIRLMKSYYNELITEAKVTRGDTVRLDLDLVSID
jgi:hypothetical protein